MSRLRTVAGAAGVIASACVGCDPAAVFGGSDPPKTPSDQAGVDRPLAVRRAAGRPALTSVERSGDPAPVVGMAVATVDGGRAAAALAALLEARLRRAGHNVDVTPSQLGVTVARPAVTSNDGPAFVQAAHAALSEPVQVNDPDVGVAAERALAAQADPIAGRIDRALANCVGGLAADPRSPKITASRLETIRKSAVHPERLGFSAVGSQQLLTATSKALSQLSDWGPAANDAPRWPAADIVAARPPGDGPARLRIAVRLANPGRGVAAARALADPTDRLGMRLATFGQAWSLRSIHATTHRFGGCVAVEVDGGGEHTEATVGTLARAIVDEVNAAAAGASDPDWALDEAVLALGDADAAARAAAWRGLTTTARQQPTRALVGYTPVRNAAKQAALTEAFGRPGFSRLTTRTRLEKGQGELYAVAATSCGLANESDANAGALAVALQAISRAPAPTGVALAPLIRDDMMGLIARGRRLSPNETPRRTAERVATALGQALAARPMNGAAVTAAREAIMGALGGKPRPAYAALLDALSPGHVSWIDPRGTWTTAQGLGADDVETARRSLTQGQLRVAVLANATRSQGEAVQRELGRWLLAARSDSTSATCPAIAAPGARAGGHEVSVTGATEPVAAAYVAVRVAPTSLAEARVLEWLLNQPRGWLAQATAEPKWGASARARILSGGPVAALAIAIHALPESVQPVIAQVRALLAQLASGTATARDVELANRHLRETAEATNRTALGRLLATWRGADARPASPGEFQRFARLTLGPSKHVVITVRARD